jgi:hypothetical protein
VLTLDNVADLLDLDLSDRPRRRRRRKKSVLTLRAGIDLLELGRRGFERGAKWLRDYRARGTADDPRLEESLEREAAERDR